MIDWGNLNAEKKIKRSKIKMYDKSPFFSYILVHMIAKEIKKDEPGPWTGKRTMAVDPNGTLYWDADFINGLTEEELTGVIAHETGHIALLHLERGKGKERQVFNYANDLVINSMLLEDGFKLPGEGLIPDNEHKFHIKELNYTVEDINKKSSEEIYSELYPLVPKIKMAIGGMGQSGSGSSGQGKNGKGGSGQKKGKDKSGGGMSEKDKENLKKRLTGFDKHQYDGDSKKDGKDGNGSGKASERMKLDRQQGWKEIVAGAAAYAKDQGKLPAGIARKINDILDSKVNWKTLLYKYVVAQIPYDYTWSRCSKRSVALGVYLPRSMNESVHIVCSIDTSGSISQDELKEFLSELLAIADVFVNINIDLIICDAAVHETYALTKDSIQDILDLKMSGGGGTDHRPIYEHIKEEISDCRVLINFTDGYTSFPENPSEIPFDSVWVICKNGCDEKHIPFGEVIKLDE